MAPIKTTTAEVRTETVGLKYLLSFYIQSLLIPAMFIITLSLSVSPLDLKLLEASVVSYSLLHPKCLAQGLIYRDSISVC